MPIVCDVQQSGNKWMVVVYPDTAPDDHYFEYEFPSQPVAQNAAAQINAGLQNCVQWGAKENNLDKQKAWDATLHYIEHRDLWKAYAEALEAAYGQQLPGRPPETIGEDSTIDPGTGIPY